MSSSRVLKASRWTLLLLVCWLIFFPALAHAQGISYVYDALGRLIAVISPGQGIAVYEFDAVGNLLSVTRYAADAVLAIDFSSRQGPVGSVVTISGANFSTTPSQNTVLFNGTQATVTAATATQLTVTVPVGATTGPISVTAPGGAGASSLSFTVTGPSAPPTIASFTPTIGAAGTPVTVTGANFELTPANNQLLLNLTPASVTTATSSTLSTTVPAGATSGHLTLTTSVGQARSTDDFFVPPSGFTTAQVGFTGRLVLGGPPLSPTFTTSQTIALLVFDGTAGQQVSLGIGSGVVGLATTIYRPSGIVLTSANTDFNGGAIQIASLPVTGTYTVLVGPTSLGSTALTLSEDLNLGAIQINGASVNVNITRRGQRARLTFSGTTGQRLTIGGSNTTRNSLYTVLNPDGSQLIAQLLSNGSFSPPPLPATGTYTLIIEPDSGFTMSVTVALSEEISGSIVIGGAAVPVTIAVPWQRARFTFDATAGQRLDLGITGSTIQWRTTILAPDNSTVATQFGGFGNTAIHTPLLTQAGTYTLLLETTDTTTGALTYTLSAEVTGTIAPGGGPVSVSIPRAGQLARLTFAGTANQRVSLTGTNLTTPSATASLLRADGSIVTTFFTDFSPQNPLFGGPATLPASETYSVLVAPSSPGNITLTLYDVPPDVTGSLTINGPSLTVTLGTPGQQAFLTLPGTAGQNVSIRGSNNSVGCFAAIFLLFSGGGSSNSQVCGTSFALPFTLGSTETFTIRLLPAQANTGSIDVQVTSP